MGCRKKVLKYQLKLPLESVTLEESDGRYLGEDVLATHDVPPFDRSPYDGFAIRAEDTARASRDEPVELNVIDSIGAGHVSKKEIKQNEAVRIMTGAAIPKGANAVIMLELVSEKENNMISISRKVEAGDNISVQERTHLKEQRS